MKKKKMLQTILVLFVATVFAAMSVKISADTVTYSHVDKATLSASEQDAIQTGLPKDTVKGDERIVLVYQKNANCSPVAPKSGNLLPKTGEARAAYAFVGLVLLGGVLFFLRKGNKKASSCSWLLRLEQFLPQPWPAPLK